MQILDVNCFQGKNIYSLRPVIKMEVDIGELCDKPTKDIKGFNETLIGMFPELKKHCCSLGYEGGFFDRLNEGTYIPHVMEHLILELQNIIGYDVAYGKARVGRNPHIYTIIFEYSNAELGMECGHTALEIITNIINNIKTDRDQIINNLKRLVGEWELGPSTKAIYDEARKRGIPAMRLGNESVLQLGYGKYKRVVQASLTDTPSCISVDMAGNKHTTKIILSENDIPVPFGKVAYNLETAVKIAEDIGYPVVIKPLDGNQGKGVTVNIKTREQTINACNEGFKYSKRLIVEKYIRGRDYRILVVGDRVSAVAERKPPFVVGDGIHTINELVDMENACDLRGEDHEKPLTRIKLDSVSREVLNRMGMDGDYIPAINEEIRLRDNGNISTGATARECTGEIHPYNSMVAVKAAKAMGLDIAGIDMTIEDISIPINRTEGAVIEVNAAPGLRMHLYPTHGQSVNVASDILDMLYPEDQPCTIPIISITGTNGKTTTTRLISHAIALSGKKAGMTSTSGIYIGNECMLKGDNAGPTSARTVLSNKEVEFAVLETARGGIVKKGLGYDAADVGVIVNISEDHLGLDDINTLEDMAFVKALVVEAVKPDGYAVLNADDVMTPYLLKRVKSKVLLFSKNSSSEIVRNHINNEGKAVLVKEGMMVLQHGKTIAPIADVDQIPITFNGIVECNVENSLAAAAALYAINTPVELIKQALTTFKPDVRQNPGRFNIFEFNDFKLMLDYSHNTAGYNAVISFAQKIKCKRLVGIIGMPGDRPDKNICEVGEMCGRAFSKIYIKEDNDLRGRQAGEIAGILYNSAVKEGARKENIEVIYSETKALEAAILDAQPGDFIIMLYEEFDPVLQLVNKFRKEMKGSNRKVDLIMQETAG